MLQQLLIAALLGIIQGITEFLPVSSTGHLVIAEHFFKISQETYGLSFDAALHLGTLFAVLLFFRKTWIEILQKLRELIITRDIHNQKNKLVLFLMIGTIPAVVLGILFNDFIESLLRSPFYVGINLILFSLILYLADRLTEGKLTINQLTFKKSFFIGLAQSVALIPGVSRSGITISAGRSFGLSRQESTRYAFLLSAPIILGAGLIKMLSTIKLFISGQIDISVLLFFGIGMIFSAIFGYLTIALFLRYLRKNSFLPFIIYRIVLGLFVLLFIH